MIRWRGILCLAVLCHAALRAQVSPLRPNLQDISAGGLSWEFWKAGEDRISHFSLPVRFVVPVNPRVAFWAATSPAFSTLSTGETYSLGGFSDMQWGGHVLAFGNRILFTFGMNLPVGTSRLSSVEHPVASVLARPAFDFQTECMGQGLDILAGVAGAFGLGGLTVGAGIGGQYKGGFRPYEDSDGVYTPGAEWNGLVTLGYNTAFGGRPLSFSGEAMVTGYLADEWEGRAVFRSGIRTLVRLSTVLSLGKADLGLVLKERWKAKNERGGEEVLETERLQSNANQFEAMLCGGMPLGSRLSARALASLKAYSDNALGYGGALLFGAGGGASYRVFSHWEVFADLLFSLGRISAVGDSAEALGLRISCGVLYAFSQ